MQKCRRGVVVVLDNDVIEDILLRIPCCVVLLRLRAVCKRWLAIIDDPGFRRRLHQRRCARPAVFLVSSPPRFEIVRFPSGGERPQSRDLWASVCGEGQGSHYQSEATPSVHGLVCVYNVSMRELAVWNPITGEDVVLAPPSRAGYHDQESSGYFSMVGLGFDPPAKKYKVVVISGKRCHALTLGTSSWRTYEVTMEDFRRLWFVTCCFCYNGVLYSFISSTFRSENSMLLTFDLGKERVRVHHASEGYSDNVQMHHRMHGSDQEHCNKCCDLSQIIWLGDSGQTIDVWTSKDRRNPSDGRFYKEFSFRMDQEDDEAEEEVEDQLVISCGYAPVVATPLCIQMGRTLICDVQGFDLYHDMLKNDDDYFELIDRFSPSSSLRPVSLHAETLLPLKDLFGQLND